MVLVADRERAIGGDAPVTPPVPLIELFVIVQPLIASIPSLSMLTTLAAAVGNVVRDRTVQKANGSLVVNAGLVHRSPDLDEIDEAGEEVPSHRRQW